MRIGVDMRYAATPSGVNGIGHYSDGHIAKLSEHPRVEVFRFTPKYEKWTRRDFIRKLSKFIEDNQIDIFHISSPIEVRYPEVFMRRELPPVHLTATVYDLIPLLFKEVYLSNQKYQKLYFQQINMLRHLDHLFAISETTRQDFLQNGIKPEQITTIGTGRDSDFCYLPAATIIDFENIFSISDPYVLAFSPGDWRKNAERLLTAFALATRDRTERWQLVFVNGVDEHTRERLNNIGREYGVADRIYFMGRVTKSQLHRLYVRAQALVMPTLYEGFGLPALEAMQCGTPVLTSNTSSMPEVVGDAAVLVDPLDVNSIADGIRKILFEDVLRQTLRQRGLERVNQFDWSLVAKHTITVWKQLVQTEYTKNRKKRHKHGSSTTFTQGKLVTVRLRPNRLKYVKYPKGKGAMYVSFNLSELPPDSSIEKAIMHIPVQKYSRKPQFFRVKADWNIQSLRLDPPHVSQMKNVINKSTLHAKKKYSVIHFECRRLAAKWAANQFMNHGIYVRHPYRGRKPSLYVTVKVPK